MLISSNSVSYPRSVIDTKLSNLSAQDIAYDNTKIQNGVGLDSSNIQDALDELEIEKLNIRDAGTNIILFPTTSASDLSGYNVMVTSTVDPAFDLIAVDVSTPPITSDTEPTIVGQLITAPGIIVGTPGLVNITTIGNIRKVSGNRNAVFYFEVYKREDDGNEVFLCASDPTPEVVTLTYRQFAESALLPITASFIETDRIVIKYLGLKTESGGGDPVYQFQFGGSDPVRTLLPVPASVAIQETWRKNGDDIFYNLGNVGIGTDTPSSKLTVSGELSATSVTTNQLSALGNVNVTGRSDLRQVFAKGLGTGTGVLAQFRDSADTNRVTILDNGNVGIGNSAPTDRLSVAGSINLATTGNVTIAPSNLTVSGSAGNFTIRASGSVGGGGQIGGDLILQGGISNTLGNGIGPEGSVRIIAGYNMAGGVPGRGIISFSTNNTTRLVINYSGNVGIGTTSPTQRLVVSGNTSISGNLSAAGVTATSLAGRFLSSDNVIEISGDTVNLTYTTHAGMYIRLTHTDGPITIVLDADTTIPKGAEFYFFKATSQPISFTGAVVNGSARIADVVQDSGFGLKCVVGDSAIYDLL
jgi:hypothetical protein